MDVHVVEVDWRVYAARLRNIRNVIFVQEQSVPEALEWDGLDADACHFLAIDSAGRDLGCARLLPTGQIGRMAVHAAERGKGIGAQLLDAAVAKAEALGMAEVFLHAQTHALDFYRRGGFTATGDEFVEAGILHRNMTRLLPVPVPESLREKVLRGIAVPAYPAPAPTPQVRQITLFTSEADGGTALASGLGQAKRDLILYSHFLDPRYFDTEPIAAVISAFARRAPATHVRMLIHSSDLIVSRGHRLLGLARRLPSKLSIRLVDSDFEAPPTCFVAWDQTGYWLLPEWREPAGSLHVRDPVAARRLFHEFELLWVHAKLDPELRELGI